MVDKDNLNKKTLKGLTTMSISSITVFIIQFITTLILARIFTPSEFGIVSAVVIVTSITDIFWQIGIGPAIIQKQDLSQKDMQTGFTASILFGLCAAIIVAVLSPFLAKLINISEASVLKAISLSFFINSFGVISLSLLQREMKFNVIIKKDIYGNLVYAFIAVILGIAGLRIWALVIALLSRYVIGTVIVWFACPIKLPYGFEKKSFKKMLRFGVGHSLSQLLNVVTNQGDNFVVTRFMGPYSLGIYGRAYQLMAVPASLFGQVLDQVFFPAMSVIQEDNHRLSNIFILASALLGLLYFPIGAAIYLFSENIVTLLLGAKWIEAALPLSILSLTIFFRVGYKINDPLFRAKGAVYNRALIHLAQAIITFTAAFIGARWGLLGVSIGVSISLIINYFIIIYKTYKLIKFDMPVFLRCMLPTMFLNILIIPIIILIKEKLTVALFSEALVVICLVGIFCVLTIITAMVIYYFVFPESIRIQLKQFSKPFLNKFKRRIRINQ